MRRSDFSIDYGITHDFKIRFFPEKPWSINERLNFSSGDEFQTMRSTDNRFNLVYPFYLR